MACYEFRGFITMFITARKWTRLPSIGFRVSEMAFSLQNGRLHTPRGGLFGSLSQTPVLKLDCPHVHLGLRRTESSLGSGR